MAICQGDSFTFGGNSYSAAGSYPHTFQTVNGCDSAVTLNLTVNPVYAGGVLDMVICQGESFTFGGNSYSAAGSYPHTFQTVNGCDSSVVLNVTVYPKPIAGFQLSGNPGDWEQGMPISVYDASTGADSYEYDVSDGFSTPLPSFDFTPGVSGYIIVHQMVTNIHGCRDEMSLPIWVDVPSSLYVPEAFTPGSNGINDVFMAYGNGITEFKMSIFNLWGELLFSSADIHSGWDGYYRGEPCKQDVYVYLIEYSTRRAARQTLRGRFTLIR
jgi:gliding motility-associated-like protein